MLWTCEFFNQGIRPVAAVGMLPPVLVTHQGFLESGANEARSPLIYHWGHQSQQKSPWPFARRDRPGWQTLSLINKDSWILEEPWDCRLHISSKVQGLERLCPCFIAVDSFPSNVKTWKPPVLLPLVIKCLTVHDVDGILPQNASLSAEKPEPMYKTLCNTFCNTVRGTTWNTVR